MTLRTGFFALALVGCTTTTSPLDTGAASTTSEDGDDGDGDGSSPTTADDDDAIGSDSASDHGSTSSAVDDATVSGSDGGSDDDTTGADPLGDPHEPGPLGFSMSTTTIDVDGTSIPLTLYVPDDAGPYPVVVLTHGFQLGPTNYASWGQHLASWGYVAVLPQLPGSLFDAPAHVQLRAWIVGVLDWIEQTAADRDAPLQGRADPAAIGLAGHSMGGKISFLTASSDSRPRAVFGIDPVDTAGGPGQAPDADHPSVTPELMPLVVVPIAVVGETTNATGGLGGACAPEAENFQQYFDHAESPALEIEILGANHMSFLDDPACGLPCLACPAGTDDPAITRRLAQGAMIAFFGRTLKRERGWTEWLVGAPMQADVDAGLVAFATANGF